MSYSPWMGNLVVQDTPGNYGTVKILIDEAAPRQPPLTVRVTVEIASQGVDASHFEVEAFTNLDRREFVKVFEPLEEAGDPASSYWIGHGMAPAGASHDNLVFAVDLPVTRCGAYRLTARYRLASAAGWWWHNDFAPSPGAPLQRDCAIVVSPAKAARLSLYEANALTVEALQGGSYQNRSTLDDFLPEADFDDFNPFDLSYVRRTLGFNALWLMPIFPNTRWRWDQSAWAWSSNEDPGSPYAARDYWAVNPWLADDGTSARAMELFQRVVSDAGNLGLDVFVDVAFNHAGRDVCYGQGAVELGLCAPEHLGDWIREVRTGWCTRGTEFRDGVAVPHYREPAHDSFSCAVWAPADRLNEHTWYDANVDWYFGDYSSLGPKGGPAQRYAVHDDRGTTEDERDLFYTRLGDALDTRDLWRYFAHIIPYWLERTSNQLAGIRADFAQGLPNQLWELIVNSARNERWDFVFLAEVLDPEKVQYRLNKVFDVLTTVWHSKFRDSDVRMPELFGALEGEATLFGGNAIVMHNGTSHDEQGNPDAWAMVARYAVAAAEPGVPMVYMGQPLGLANKLDFQHQFTNMYDVWTAQGPRRAAVADMYRRINEARSAAPELTSPSRYHLNLVGGGFHDRVFSAARWVGDGARDSVVLAFVNLSTTAPEAGTFAFPRILRLSGDYQVRNLVASDPDALLWDSPRSADDIFERGIYVRFSFPNEIQFLRLVPA